MGGLAIAVSSVCTLNDTTIDHLRSVGLRRPTCCATEATQPVVLLTLYAKSQSDNLTGAKLKEIRRPLES
jgi:hypothetical protein